MSRVYKATGINLRSMPLGEADRLLTILTREYGLIKAVAPGCRKPKSSLGGRSALFVVNELLMVQGRSLDKISQAESLESYPGLSQNLAKLTASQYLAELVLYQALSGQPQAELWELFCQQLTLLQRADPHQIPYYLVIGILQLLEEAGVGPQVQTCCLTQQPLTPDRRDPTWRVGFSPQAGGTITLSALASQSPSPPLHLRERAGPKGERGLGPIRLTMEELFLLQQLSHSLTDGGDLVDHASLNLSMAEQALPLATWQGVEFALRHYAEAYFGKPIRSAALIDTCFTALLDLPSPVQL
ncbi:MAG: DNA repair protein RecO [Acaryochloridaceae cyanobacterium SU_2_1]|nr:DNA repair protein RecO [Acaryochloridaceae cyanobacterium SU_2_1]